MFPNNRHLWLPSHPDFWGVGTQPGVYKKNTLFYANLRYTSFIASKLQFISESKGTALLDSSLTTSPKYFQTFKLSLRLPATSVYLHPPPPTTRSARHNGSLLDLMFFCQIPATFTSYSLLSSPPALVIAYSFLSAPNRIPLGARLDFPL